MLDMRTNPSRLPKHARAFGLLLVALMGLVVFVELLD
jgi:hypothetical protein